MNNYIKNLEELKSKSTKIQLETVKKVETLIKDLTKETDTLDSLVKKGISLDTESDTLFKKQQDMSVEANEISKEARKIYDVWNKMSDDAISVGKQARSAESVVEGLENKLRQAAEALEKGAKQLGVPVPPVVSKVDGVLSDSQKSRVKVEDLKDW